MLLQIKLTHEVVNQYFQIMKSLYRSYYYNINSSIPIGVKQMQLQNHINLNSSQLKWIIAPEQLQSSSPFIKAKIIQKYCNEDTSNTDNHQQLFQAQIQSKMYKIKRMKNQVFDISHEQQFNDMCQMSIINEPEIMHNLIRRFKKDQIFTYIGPTLIVVNPYKQLKSVFDNNAILQFRQKIKNENFDYENPHLYMIAGKALDQLLKSKKPQTIIISGESGAGKTQSTKYCLQMLASLNDRDENNISQKIIECNPILQAFGNSKTVKNDNSSRFGKFLKIYIDEQTNCICGGKIDTYLLQKSRIVNVSKNQRNFHCFYALTNSKQFNTLSSQKYTYLNKSGEYKANHINDQINFQDVNQAMKKIGFTQSQINKIWNLLKCILELGNIQIQDSRHQLNESQPCSIKNKKILNSICQILNLQIDQFQKLILYQKRKFLKQQLLIPYNKVGCRANLDTLSKQIYSKVFEKILKIINRELVPGRIQEILQINILDIFGFQNFLNNSLEQICINFANETLLKLYNQYVFQKQILILKEDGILEGLQLFSPVSNNVIHLLQGKNSIFSIINQITPHKQYTDQNILQTIKKQIKSQKVSFCKKRQQIFSIQHSQCLVEYKISEFKTKNQDKVNDQILQISCKIFDSMINEKKQEKTVLSKFSKQIKDLMQHIQSSSVHFIRCLKPNQQKKPSLVNQSYLLKQIRYLGIFQTIKIRQKSFPIRKTHQQMQIYYRQLLQKQKLKDFQKLLFKLQDKSRRQEYLIGKKRIYLSNQFDLKLNKMLIQFRKKKRISIIKIQKQFRMHLLRKNIIKKLKIILRKEKHLSSIFRICESKLLRAHFSLIFQFGLEKVKLQNQKRQTSRQNQNKELLNRRKILIDKQLVPSIPIIEKFYQYNLLLFAFSSIKLILKQNSQIKNQTYQNQKAHKRIDQQSHQPANLKVPQPANLKAPQVVNLKIPQSANQKSHWSVNQESHWSVNQESNWSVIQNCKTQQPYKMQKEQSCKKIIQEVVNFSKDYLNYNSVASKEESIIYKSNLKVSIFNAHQKKSNMPQLSPTNKDQQKKGQFQINKSKYTNFQLQKVDSQLQNKIINFQQGQFEQKYMRKRKTFFGKQKKFKDIFQAKHQPLQKSLSKLSQQNQYQTLLIFKQVLKLMLQGSIQFVLQIVENFLQMCLQKSQQTINQTVLILLKQSNSKIKNFSYCVYQLFYCFLHVFCPTHDFLIAALYILLCRISERQGCSEQVKQIQNCIVNKIIFKLTNKQLLFYFPSKYQIFCLMCKKCIACSIYMPLGNNIKINCEPTDTLLDKKQQILNELGIYTKRINKNYFHFFQIVNFQNAQLDEVPLPENQFIWDIKSSWQLAEASYSKQSLKCPKFFILVKLLYPFQLQIFDQQGIQLFFNQCFFDYFTGRIRFTQELMIQIGSYIALIKKITLARESAFQCFPIWFIKIYGLQKTASQLAEAIYSKHSQAQQMDDFILKANVIKICQNNPLSMSFSLPTQNQLAFLLKPRRLYVTQKKNCKILEQYQLKYITKWGVDDEKFHFQIINKLGQNNKKTYVFFTQFAKFFAVYLKRIQSLI